MIEKIFVPTLERLPARRYLNLGALTTMGVPHEIIEYFPARDAHAYAGDPRAAINDAISEGFKLRPKMVAEWSRPGTVLKHFCIPWTFTMIFQKIMQMPANQYFMFLLDDYRLACDFFYLNELVETVHEDAKNQKALIIQLDVLHIIDFPAITDLPPVKRFKGLVRGLSGAGDAGLIVNPEGARILYEELCRTGGVPGLELALWKIAQEHDQSGFYSTSITNQFVQHIGDYHT